MTGDDGDVIDIDTSEEDGSDEEEDADGLAAQDLADMFEGDYVLSI